MDARTTIAGAVVFQHVADDTDSLGSHAAFLRHEIRNHQADHRSAGEVLVNEFAVDDCGQATRTRIALHEEPPFSQSEPEGFCIQAGAGDVKAQVSSRCTQGLPIGSSRVRREIE